jgi:hypothetical protein
MFLAHFNLGGELHSGDRSYRNIVKEFLGFPNLSIDSILRMIYMFVTHIRD